MFGANGTLRRSSGFFVVTILRYMQGEEGGHDSARFQPTTVRALPQ